MPRPPRRGECARCAALCCVAFAFDRSESFGLDKAADVVCRNLDGAGGCRIHARLAASGFGGCVAFDCAGAGQVVTQEMFGGRSWRDEPALLPVMTESFRLLRRVHELRLLLNEAQKLGLDAAEMETLEAFERALMPHGGWTLEALREFEQGRLAADVRGFLASLGRFRRRAGDRSAA